MSGSNLQHWVKIGGICLFFLLITYGVLSLEAQQKKGMGPSRPTTYSTTPGGYKALYLWVRELGVPFRRWERPFGQLSRSASVLLVVTPQKPVGSGEIKALDRWVNTVSQIGRGVRNCCRHVVRFLVVVPFRSIGRRLREGNDQNS